MPDIANLGFRADSQELVDAKNRMDALGPAAGRAERSAAILEKIFGKLDGTADKLIAAITGLQGSVERSTASYDKNATAAQRAASANDTMSMAAGKVTVTFNGVTSAATKVVTGTEKVTKTAQAATGAINAEAAAVNKLASANDNLASKSNVDNSKSLYTAQTANMRNATPSGAAVKGLSDEQFAAAKAANELARANDNLRAKYNPLYAVIRQYKDNVAEVREANRMGAISVDEMSAALARQRGAALTAIGAIKGTGQAGVAAAGALAGAGKNLKLRTDEMLNLSRQASDIGVTLAMGMNPLMVAIQQGPQIADVFQTAAQRGIGFKAVLAQIGAVFYATIAPLLPVILAIGAAFATIGIGFALGARDIDKGAGDIAKSMGLTEKQMERLKKSGVETTVTIGDTFKAFFEVLGGRFAKAFEGPVSATQKVITAALDQMATDGANVIRSIVGTFVGGYYAIVALWKTMPRTFEGIGALVANAFIATFEGLINRILGQINGINDKINGAMKAVGLDFQLVKLAPIKIDRMANKEAEDAGAAVAAGFEKGMNIGVGMTNRFFKDVRSTARKNRTALIKDAAGDAAKAAKPKGGKSDAEKFSDIVNGAQRDIATTQAEIAGINLTADAALRLKNEQKLLNEAQQKGLTLTGTQRAELMALAGTLTDLQIKLKNLTGFKEIAKGAEENMAALLAERGALGLTGEAALTYGYKMDLLAQARAKGLTVGDKELAQFDRMASALGRVAQANANLKYFIDARNQASESLDNSRAELATLGMSTEAATDYLYAQKLANDEKYRGITLSASQRAELIATNSTQTALNARINQTREAMDFAKDSAKGFVNDLTNGLKQGENVFKTFGNAVLNVLDKVLNKLTDVALNAAMGGGSGGSVGGFFSTLLGSIGMGGKSTAATGGVTAQQGLSNFSFAAKPFAKGAGFMNGIVDRPTAFAFGKGGADLGIMGEDGPEGVLPLQRGPDGSLGVQMYGGTGGGGMIINAPISIANDNRVTGAVSSDDIVEMQRKSAESTKRELARELPEIISQFQRDGTYSG